MQICWRTRRALKPAPLVPASGQAFAPGQEICDCRCGQTIEAQPVCGQTCLIEPAKGGQRPSKGSDEGRAISSHSRRQGADTMAMGYLHHRSRLCRLGKQS